MNTASDAQARANDIAAFRRELARLDAEGMPTLGDDQRRALNTHHDALLANLAQDFAIDRDLPASQLSLGMRIASFLGALALSASVYFFFYRFWGHFGVSVQVEVLLGDRAMTVPAWIRPALDEVRARETFTPADLPLDEQSNLVLSRRLVREGLLEIG